MTNRRGLLDAWVLAGHAKNAGSTHSKARCRIDYRFVPNDLAGSVSEVWVDDQATGSDHWTVWATFTTAPLDLTALPLRSPTPSNLAMPNQVSFRYFKTSPESIQLAVMLQF